MCWCYVDVLCGQCIFIYLIWFDLIYWILFSLYLFITFYYFSPIKPLIFYSASVVFFSVFIILLYSTLGTLCLFKLCYINKVDWIGMILLLKLLLSLSRVWWRGWETLSMITISDPSLLSSATSSRVTSLEPTTDPAFLISLLVYLVWVRGYSWYDK